MSTEDLLKSFAKTPEAEANEKITKAIRTWINCDNECKTVTLIPTGFSG